MRPKIRPLEKLSLQMHQHKAGNLVLIAGAAKARVTREEETLTLSQNETVLMPFDYLYALESLEKFQ